jgi:hypothetical protein
MDIETVAWALARFRLGKETFVSSLNPDLVGKLRQSAENKLSPALVGEASAVIEAIEASGQDANGPILEHQEAAAIPREAAPVSEPETVDKGVAIRADHAPTTGAPPRELGDALPGAVQPLQDPQPAEMTPSRSALPMQRAKGFEAPSPR